MCRFLSLDYLKFWVLLLSLVVINTVGVEIYAQTPELSETFPNNILLETGITESSVNKTSDDGEVESTRHTNQPDHLLMPHKVGEPFRISGSTGRVISSESPDNRTQILCQWFRLNTSFLRCWTNFPVISKDVTTKLRSSDSVDVLGKALSDFQKASNRLPYLNALRERSNSNNPNDAINKQLEVIVDNKDFETYTAKFAKIYVDCSNNPKAKEISTLIENYLRNGDYFAERLRLEISKVRKLISREVYESEIRELLERYSDRIELSKFDTNPENIRHWISITFLELVDVGIRLSVYDVITTVVKDWSPVALGFLTLFFAWRKLKLDERQDKLALKKTAKGDRIVVEPTDDDIRKYS